MVLWKWARIFLLSCKNGKNGDWSEYFIDDSFSYLHSNRFLISLYCRAILLCLKNIWISVPSHTPVMREILLGFGLTLVSFLYLLWICMYSPRKSKPTQLYTKIATVDNISSHSCLQHSRLIIFFYYHCYDSAFAWYLWLHIFFAWMWTFIIKNICSFDRSQGRRPWGNACKILKWSLA